MTCRLHSSFTLRGLSAACVAVALVACGGDGDGKSSDPQACSTEPVPSGELPEMPKNLSLEKYGTIVQASTRAGYVGAKAISETTVVELYPQLNRDILDGGYEIISGENEGFEAEVFFRKGRNTGTFLVREGPCKGQVTVRLLYGAPPKVPKT